MSITYVEADKLSIKELKQEYDKLAKKLGGHRGLELTQVKKEIEYRQQREVNKWIIVMTIVITICTIVNTIYIIYK